MDRISTKTWMIIGTMGMVLFFTYWMRFAHQHGSPVHASPAFSYEMPRPQNFEPGFDLSDRSVNRRYKTLPALPSKPAVTVAKVDPKKHVPAKVAKKPDVKKKAAQTAQTQKAKKTAVNVVDTSRAQTMTALPQETSSADTNPVAQNHANYRKAEAPVADDSEVNDKPEEETLTISHWRSLLQTAPNAANISKFVKAKQAGKVDSAAYYQIVHELLVDSAEDRKKAAFAIMDQDVSASTFAFMVLQSDLVPADLHASLKTRIDSYSQVGKFSYLIRALGSSAQPKVLEAAVERVSAALTVYVATQNTTQTTTGGTRNVASTITAQQFTSLIPTLKRLEKNPNPMVVAMVTQLMSQIQNIAKTQSGSTTALETPGMTGATASPAGT